MTKTRALDVETLWQLARVGGVALSPGGELAVCSLSHYSMQDNNSSAALWLMDTGVGKSKGKGKGAGSRSPKARQLTRCGSKDGQAAFAPRHPSSTAEGPGERIAFIARREQEGSKDKTPQLYLIDTQGGEAQRVSQFGPGVESFKWLPCGRRIVFSAWVWPHLRGAAAQNKQQQAQADRKETGYATSEGQYRYWDHNLPQGRVLHLLLLELKNGRVTDLFEGTPYELPRTNDGHAVYDVHPGTGEPDSSVRIVFAHDPAAEQKLGNPFAITELLLPGVGLKAGSKPRFRSLLQDPAWDFGHPRYSPDGRQLAATAANSGRVHTAFNQLVTLNLPVPTARTKPAWQVLPVLPVPPELDVNGPLRWSSDQASIYFSANARGRCHLWCHGLASGQSAMSFEGGTVQGFDVAGPTLLVVADSALHPARVHAAASAEQPHWQRLENFNDRLLAGVQLGKVEEVNIKGALGEPVQMWLTFPPGLDPSASRKPAKGKAAPKQHPVNQVIHGGPYAAAGDSFSYRWNAHVLASRGHVVAQLNFHGSNGFGWEFAHSLVGRQGELELQDIEAGTDWLLRQDWADPSRIFATGGSYGGFLVAWMNGHVPAGRYRAYVCHAGVFDRVATFCADSYPVRPKDLAASFWQDLPKVLAQSPHAFAGAMNTPTLVIHGAKDFRVPDCNGLAYYNTLKARGVPARLLWFPDENHWVLKPRNSRQWYGEFADWLDLQGAAKASGPKKKKVSARN